MVWGMSLPKSGGAYGPYGKYEDDGWRGRLSKYYVEQTPERQATLYSGSKEGPSWDYPFFVGWKFIGELGTKCTFEDPPLTPIEDHEPPRFFCCEKGFDSLASIISLPSGIWAIEETTKNIIERIEPDVHQFYPIEIRMPRGKVYPITYFTLVVGQYIESLVPEKCKEGVLRPYGSSNRYHSDESKNAISGRAFSREKFGKAHLWRERGFGGAFSCLSDELWDEIRKLNLLMPKHYKMIEV